MSAIQQAEWFRGDGTPVNADGTPILCDRRRARILAWLIDAGPRGVARSELYGFCNNKARLLAILDDLIANGLVQVRTQLIGRTHVLKTTYHATLKAYFQEPPR